jgi:hypothetical protein
VSVANDNNTTYFAGAMAGPKKEAGAIPNGNETK